uniref:Uncharacterized protein n=1 Tax=Bionectria ochroleuca TaxID=29856 RepID=A0A8H7NQN0_BIOOC
MLCHGLKILDSHQREAYFGRLTPISRSACTNRSPSRAYHRLPASIDHRLHHQCNQNSTRAARPVRICLLFKPQSMLSLAIGVARHLLAPPNFIIFMRLQFRHVAHNALKWRWKSWLFLNVHGCTA